jgi:ABC-type transport system involved in cytochrome bd biosynthesis fused ATPase/permease subunit
MVLVIISRMILTTIDGYSTLTPLSGPLRDEPTSGLDTFTARHVMESLQGLAMKGRTVVLSIHQVRM